MAFTDLGSLGSTGNTGNNQVSLVLTTTAAVAVGDFIVVVVAVDNRVSGGGDDLAVSGVTNSGTAQTWTKAIQVANAVAAQGGASVSIWYTQATAVIASGATITATFTLNTTSDASAMTARKFSVSAGSTVAIEGTPGTLLHNTALDPGALDVTTSNITALRIRGCGIELGSATNWTPTGSWTAWAGGQSATSGTTGEMAARAEHIIGTGTSFPSNPTQTSAINANAYVAFKEIIPDPNITVNVTSPGLTASLGTVTATIPAIAYAWSLNDKSANYTLSNSDRTATLSTSVLGGVRSTQQQLSGAAGKYYAEFVWTGGNVVGILNSTTTLTDTTKGYYYSGGVGFIFLAGASSGRDLGTPTNGDVFSLAWDTGAKRFWMRRNLGNWNNSATANPATGVDGLDLSATITANNFALWATGQTSGQNTTVRTRYADYTQGVPTGFTSWMAEPLPLADAWNTYDKSSNITLSDSDKTSTLSSAVAAGIRSTTLNNNTGLNYAEFKINTLVSNVQVGLMSATSAIANAQFAFAVTTTGTCFDYVTSRGSIGALATGDVICLAWRGQKVWVRKGDGLWNNDALADPSTNINGMICSISVPVALWSYSSGSGTSVTVRTKFADFTQAVPAGLTSWINETPSTANAWNVYDKTATITLSNSDKLATNGFTPTGGVRTTKTYNTLGVTKHYAEFVVASVNTVMVGLKPKATLFTTDDLAHIRTITGNFWLNGVDTGNSLGAFVDNDVLSMAWDIAAKRIWFRKNAGNWNNSGTADPAANVGGWDITAFASGTVAIAFQLTGYFGNVLLRTELVEYTQTRPVAFQSWMGEATPTLDAWNVADKTVNLTLSNSDRTALGVTASQAVRSTKTYVSGTAGKYYAELVAGSGIPSGLGLSPLTNAVATATGTIKHNFYVGLIYLNNTSTGIDAGSLNTGDVSCMAWDAGANLVWFRRNNGNWNGNAANDPATGVGGISFTLTPATAHALWLDCSINTNRDGTIRTKLAQFTQAVPTGFSSWMGETPVVPEVTVNVTSPGLTASLGTATATGAGAAGETVPWTPADIGSDLLAWYDFADAATVIQSGGFLTQWRDKSGNARHANAMSAGVLSINADGIYIANATSGPNLAIQMPALPSAYFDFAFAGKPNPFGSYRTLMAQQVGGQHHALIEVGTNKLGSYANSWCPAGSLEWPPVDGQIYYSGADASSVRLGRDGDTLVDEVGETFVPDNAPCLFNYSVGGGQGFGTGREFVFMTASQSQDIRDKVSGYLAWKWDGILGVTTHVAALPAGHPYKSAAPTVVGHAWTPADLTTGLTNWFDAADASKLTWSGSNLTQWTDKSPAGRDAVAISTGPTLTAVNGLGSLRFDNQPLQIAATSYGDFTIFAVYKTDPSPAGARTYERIADHNSAAGWWMGRYALTEQFGGGVKNLVDPYGYHVALPSGQTQLLSIKRQGATHYTAGNGGAVSNSGACDATATASNPVFIGIEKTPTPTFVSPLYGVLSEFIIWSNALSVADQARAEGYLAWKWGLQANLPAGHTYKSAAPRIGGEPAAVSVTANVTTPGLTASLGTVTPTGKAVVSVTSPALSAALGTVTPTGKAVVSVTNPALLTVSRGTVTPTGKAVVSVTNPALLTTAVGTTTITGKANVPITTPGLLTTSLGTADAIGTSSSGPLWTPALISADIFGWWDPSVAGSLSWSGPNLLEMADQSPANHKVGRAAASGPTATTLNGLGALQYVPGQGIATPVLTQFDDFTVCAVFKPGTATATYDRIVDHAYASGWWVGRTGNTQTWGGGVLDGPGTSYGQFVPLADNDTHQISSMRAGDQHTISGNGGAGLLTRAVTAAQTAAVRVTIADDNNDLSPMTGVIGEVLVWSRALPADELAKVEGYLAHKWGIQDKLPVAHPYKLVAPTTALPPTLPVFRAVASTIYGSQATGITIAKPAGTIDGDVMIASVFTGRGSPDIVSMTPPVGWTPVAAATQVKDSGDFHGRFQMFWRRASSEPASYDWTHIGYTQSDEGCIVSYSDCMATGSPIDTYSTNNAVTSVGSGHLGAAIALSVTTTAANDMLVIGGHNWDIYGSTPPPGGTERYDHLVTSHEVPQPTAGPTGDLIYVSGSNDPQPWQSWLVALKGSSDAPPAVSVTVNVTSPQIAVSLGTVTPTGKANVTFTTPSGLATSLGTTTPTGKAIVSVVSPASTTALGTVTPTGKAVVSITSPSIAASVGTATGTGKSNVTVANPALLTTAVGTVDVTGKAVAYVFPSPAGLTTTVGTATATGKANVSVLATTQMTAAVGTVTVGVTVSVTANVTTPQLTASVGNVGVTQGQGVSASPASTPQLTTALGTIIVTTQQKVNVTTPQLTTALGTVAITQGQGVTAFVTSPGMTASVGTAVAKTQQNITVATPQLTAGLGGVSVEAGGSISVSFATPQITTAVGNVTVTANRNIQTPVTSPGLTTAITGVTATGKANTNVLVTPEMATSVGTVTAVGKANVTAFVTTPGLIASVGTVTPSGKATANVTSPGLLTAATNQVTSTGKANVYPTTPQLTASLGGVTVSAGGSIGTQVSSPQITAAVGTVSVTARVTATANVATPGLTASLGTISVYPKTTVFVTAPAGMTAAIGAAESSSSGNEVVTPNSPAISAAVGVVEVQTGISFQVTAPPQITVSLGVPTLSGKATAFVTSPRLLTALGAVKVAAGGAGLNVWTGTEWANKPAMVWTGDEWVQKTAKQWTGDLWV